MTEKSSSHQDIQAALGAFIRTDRLEEASSVLEEYPILLSDQADVLFSLVIDSARKQGHEDIASALDERRNFLRNVRQKIENNKTPSSG
jgi:hypothetical protein